MNFINEDICDLSVGDKMDQDGDVSFTIYDEEGCEVTTAYLNKSNVKELIKHLQKVLGEDEVFELRDFLNELLGGVEK